MPSLTRSLAPKTRSGRVRNVMPLNAPAPAVDLAAVLRKSRRVTSESDGIDHLLLRRELPVGLRDPGFGRVAVMDDHTVAENERVAGRNRQPPVLMPVAGKLLDAERIRRQQAVGAGVPVGGRTQVAR